MIEFVLTLGLGILIGAAGWDRLKAWWLKAKAAVDDLDKIG
jgi:hypothetical protein